ncbi:ATP-binding protein [Anoxynatronum sibiricum]|uniref:Stage 0 sporulation protein A homolog n=1 Tax=Anoxynatronum sibiricum TaxID=210623 RepID=A0ABU9VVW5_9CLOT
MKKSQKVQDMMERMTSAGCFIKDYQTNQITWSHEMYSIFGVTPEAFSHTHEGFLESVHPDDLTRVSQMVVDEQHQGGEYEREYRIIRKNDGAVRCILEIGEVEVDASGRILCATGVLKDNTEQKEKETGLGDSENRFRRLVDGMPAQFKEFLPDSTLTYVNQYYCNDYGMTEAELIGRRFLELLPEEKRESVAKSYLSLTPEKPFCIGTFSRVKKGETRWRQWRYRAIFDEAGVALRYQAMGIDVTENRQTNAALRKANAEMKKAVKISDEALQEKSRFLASMSHEIRTPLNGLVGMIHLMQLTELTEEQQELAILAHTSSDLLLNLINNILDYAKMEDSGHQMDNHEFVLDEVLHAVEMVFAPMIKMKGLAFRIHRDKEIPHLLKSDSMRLKQVLINLLGNALKFTKEGSIQLSVEMVKRQDQQMMLQWTVKDTGVGIPLEDQERIFNRFAQVKNGAKQAYDGTGLGLAICKSIVGMMKGHLWVESQEGKGSRFFFTTEVSVPAAQTESLEEEKKADSAGTENLIQLLVADDDENMRFVIDRIGEKRGWQVTQAENGRVAIALCQEKRFDMILMDMHMPVLDGSEATQKVRKMDERKGIHTPIIAVTAKALPGDREACLAAGVDEYLAKPFQAENLIEMVEVQVRSQRAKQRDSQNDS